MEATLNITVRINEVCEGYKWAPVGSGRRTIEERGWWVTAFHVNDSTFHSIWRKSYEELREAVRSKYGMTLPNERDLRFMNYGEPYNRASV